MKKIFALGFLAIAAALGPTAFAEENSAPGVRGQIRDGRENIREEKQDRKEDGKTLRQDFRADRATLKNSTSTKRETAEQVRDLRQDLQEDVKARNEEAREKIKDERAHIRDLKEERRREQAKKHFDHMVARMVAHIERLEKLADRIDSRIKKFEATGRDMTKAKQLLVTAEAKISAAKSALETFKTEGSAIVATIASTTPKDTLKNLKSLADVVEKAIKEAHRALVDAVNSMIPGKPGRATTTPPTATSTGL